MVCVTEGDLLKEEVDVIVNSVGTHLKYGFEGAIGKWIVRKCGKEIISEAILQAQNQFNREELKVGEFVDTTAWGSKSHKFVLHCVCPEWESKNCELVLKNLIKAIFEFWEKNKVISISVPPMSSGVLRFPLENCAKAFFDGIMEFLEDHDMTIGIKKLNIVVFEAEKARKFQEEWDNLFKNKYGEDASDIEQSGDELSDSDDDVPAQVINKKVPLGAMKKNAAQLGSSSDEEEKTTKQSKIKTSIKKKKLASDSDESDFKQKKKKPAKATKKFDSSEDSDSSDGIKNKKATTKK